MKPLLQKSKIYARLNSEGVCAHAHTRVHFNSPLWIRIRWPSWHRTIKLTSFFDLFKSCKISTHSHIMHDCFRFNPLFGKHEWQRLIYEALKEPRLFLVFWETTVNSSKKPWPNSVKVVKYQIVAAHLWTTNWTKIRFDVFPSNDIGA